MNIRTQLPSEGGRRRFSTVAILSVAFLIGLSILAIVHTSRMGAVIDDAYITLTYARSLANGNGFRAHPNAEPSLGTTTPGWTFLLAAASRILPTVPMPELAKWLSTVFWIATAWLWYVWGRSAAPDRIVRFAIACAILVETTLWSDQPGMETRFYCFLLTLTLLLFLADRPIWSGIGAGFLFLARPEGIIVLGAMLVYQLATIPNPIRLKAVGAACLKVVRAGAASLLVIVPWALYAGATIGVIIPQTVAAKSIQVDLGFVQPFGDALWGFLSRGWNSLGVVEFDVFRPLSFTVAFLLACAGFGFALVYCRRALIFAIWVGLVIAAYLLLRAPGYTWYPLPVGYVLTVFAALALASPVYLLRQAAAEFNLPPLRLAALLAGALILAGMLIRINPLRDVPSAGTSYGVDYRRLGEWLEQNTAADARIAYLEVGTLSWYSNREIVDLLGLITPSVIPYLENQDYPGAFFASAPDYLIYTPPFGWALNGIITSAEFSRQYAPVFETEFTTHPTFIGQPIIVYQRSAEPQSGDSAITLNLADAQIAISDGFLDPQVDGSSIAGRAGDDPFVILSGLDVCADDIAQISFTLTASPAIPEELRLTQFFFAREGEGFSEDRSFFIPISADDAPHEYAFSTSVLNNWRGVIESVRFDPVNGGTGAEPIELSGITFIPSAQPAGCE